MRRTWIAGLLLGAGLCGWFGRHALGEDAPGGGAMPSDAEMEKMMEALGTPGEPHKWLAAQEGTWEVKAKMYEKGKVEESTGTATIKMLLGGRWQEQVFTGSFKGKPFEGRGMTGYDNAKKQFVNYWFDSMSTSAGVSVGPMPEDKKTLVTNGEWEMPGMKMTYKSVLTVKSANEMQFTMTGSFGGQETPFMEMTYTRK